MTNSTNLQTKKNKIFRPLLTLKIVLFSKLTIFATIESINIMYIAYSLGQKDAAIQIANLQLLRMSKWRHPDSPWIRLTRRGLDLLGTSFQVL